MFKVFINASDSIYEAPHYYKFVDYDTFKQVLDKLLLNVVMNNERIEIDYSEYIVELKKCVLKYQEENHCLNIETYGVGSTRTYCTNHSMDGFIIFKNDCEVQSITNYLVNDEQFEKTPKRIIYIDESGNIVKWKNSN